MPHSSGTGNLVSKHTVAYIQRDARPRADVQAVLPIRYARMRHDPGRQTPDVPAWATSHEHPSARLACYVINLLPQVRLRGIGCLSVSVIMTRCAWSLQDAFNPNRTASRGHRHLDIPSMSRSQHVMPHWQAISEQRFFRANGLLILVMLLPLAMGPLGPNYGDDLRYLKREAMPERPEIPRRVRWNESRQRSTEPCPRFVDDGLLPMRIWSWIIGNISGSRSGKHGSVLHHLSCPLSEHLDVAYPVPTCLRYSPRAVEEPLHLPRSCQVIVSDRRQVHPGCKTRRARVRDGRKELAMVATVPDTWSTRQRRVSLVRIKVP